jgi:hypothetical protein
MKRKWHIEWSILIPRQEGWDEVEAETVGEARRIYKAAYPRRYINAISLVEPPRAPLDLARAD